MCTHKHMHTQPHQLRHTNSASSIWQLHILTCYCTIKYTHSPTHIHIPIQSIYSYTLTVTSDTGPHSHTHSHPPTNTNSHLNLRTTKSQSHLYLHTCTHGRMHISHGGHAFIFSLSHTATLFTLTSYSLAQHSCNTRALKQMTHVLSGSTLSRTSSLAALHSYIIIHIRQGSVSTLICTWSHTLPLPHMLTHLSAI